MTSPGNSTKQTKKNFYLFSNDLKKTHTTGKEEALSNSFNDVTNTLIPKPDEVTTEKEYYRFFL